MSLAGILQHIGQPVVPAPTSPAPASTPPWPTRRSGGLHHSSPCRSAIARSPRSSVSPGLKGPRTAKEAPNPRSGGLIRKRRGGATISSSNNSKRPSAREKAGPSLTPLRARVTSMRFNTSPATPHWSRIKTTSQPESGKPLSDATTRPVMTMCVASDDGSIWLREIEHCLRKLPLLLETQHYGRWVIVSGRR